MHTEETATRAEKILKGVGAHGSILDTLLALLKSLLDGCTFSSEQIAAMLEHPGPFVRIRARQVVLRELYNLYGPGAWRDYNGEELVAKLLAAGKKATAADFEALRS